MERWQSHHGRRGRGRGNHSSNISRSSNYASKTASSVSGSETNAKQVNINPENRANLVGTCPLMCPVSERIQRERLQDLAVFERLNGNPSKSSPSLAVKKFRRTISTTELHDADLRPLSVLHETLNHLLTIFESKSHPFEAIHEFIFDRTRSIRQDLSMQNIVFGDQAVDVYERIVKFHIVSHYKLRRDSVIDSNSNVSPMHYLNFEQLTKALSSLYRIYDENRKSNPEFYSFYVLLHLGSDNQPTGESLSLWFRTIPYSVLKSKEMMFSRRLLRYFRFGNYKRFLETTENEATRLQFYIIEPYICGVRALGLACLNNGGYKLNPYPLEVLCKHLLIAESDVESFCKDCGIDTFASETGTKFMEAKQTSFRYPKESHSYYPLMSKRLEQFYDAGTLKNPSSGVFYLSAYTC